MLVSKFREVLYLLSVLEGYDIGIARPSVRQLPKTSSIQYRSCTTVKSGPGGI